MKLSVILPTYNERDNIAPLIEQLSELLDRDTEFIVVDDSSPDGTAEAVGELAGRIPGVRLIKREERGLVGAIQRGIDEAEGEIVAWMDCDFSMPPETMPLLVAEVAEDRADAAIGSRFAGDGSAADDANVTALVKVHRKLAGCLNRFAARLLGRSFSDWTSGFIAIRSELIKGTKLRGYYGEYFIRLATDLFKQNASIVEIPYRQKKRRSGESKTTGSFLSFIGLGLRYLRTLVSCISDAPEAAKQRGAGHVLNCILLILLVMAAYGGSLNYDFVWDDYGLIVSNDQIQDVGAWKQWGLQGFWQRGENVIDPSRSFYRPLITLSYMLDYAAAGLDPRQFHMTNLVGHGLCVILVYALGLQLLRGRAAALAAAALFAVHPTHVENVCWISGRTDIFCALFFVGAVLALLRWHTSGRRPGMLVFMTALYLLALLSKEAALSFPLLAVIYIFLKSRGEGLVRAAALPAILLGSTTMFYLMLRSAVLGTIIPSASFGTFMERITALPMVFAKYLGLLAGIAKTDPHHADLFLESVFSARALLFVVVTALFAITTLALLFRRRDPAAFLAAWLPITLLPVMHLGAFGDVLYADRFLYIPSMGIAMLFVFFARRFLWNVSTKSVLLRFLAVVLAIAMTGIWIILSSQTARRWSSNLSLFTYSAKTSPSSAYVLFNLGKSHTEEDQHVEAISAYQGACRLEPDFAEAHTNLGITYVRVGRYREAIASIIEGINNGDDSAIAYSSLGEAYRAVGLWEHAEFAYRKALLHERSVVTYNNLGECLVAAGRYDAARQCFTAALQIEQRPEVYNNLAMLCLDTDNPVAALEHLQIALSFRDRLTGDMRIAIHYNCARALRDMDIERAGAHARKVLALARELGPKGERYQMAEWLLELAEQ